MSESSSRIENFKRAFHGFRGTVVGASFVATFVALGIAIGQTGVVVAAPTPDSGKLEDANARIDSLRAEVEKADETIRSQRSEIAALREKIDQSLEDASPTPQPESSSPETDAKAAPAEAVKRVDIELGDDNKIGEGIYEVGASGKAYVDYRWFTTTSLGPIESGIKDCTVVTTVTERATGKEVYTDRSAYCSDLGYTAEIPPGEHTLKVDVALANSSRASGVVHISAVRN